MDEQQQQVPLDIRPLASNDKDRSFIEYQLHCEAAPAQLYAGMQVPSAVLFGEMPIPR